jgi:glycosyltransferase involved in cell wall biosynthesis
VRIVFVIPDAEIGGGVSVATAHARNAIDAGHDVTLAVSDWNPKVARTVQGISAMSLAEAMTGEYDLAIASWWQDVLRLSQLSAATQIQFIQAPEDLLYRPGDLSFDLVRDLYRVPIPAVTIAEWLAEHLHSAYGRDRPIVVRNGVNKSVFRPDGPSFAPRTPDRLRVLVEGALGVWNKNVLPALRVSRANADETWLLTPTPVGPIVGVNRVFSGISPHDVAAVYRSCDVVLKLSTVEGFALPPLEMFHCGGTSVVFDAQGPTEYAEDGRNALVATVGDFRAAGERLALLRSERALLDRLKAGALATADAWPSEETSGHHFLEAVTALATAEPKAGTRVPRELESRIPLVSPPRVGALTRMRRHSLVRSLACSLQVRLPVDPATQRLRLPLGRTPAQ